MALDQQRQIESLKRELTEARSLITDLQQQLNQRSNRPASMINTTVLEALATNRPDMLPLFQAMVERSSEAITVADAAAHIIYANQATYELYRYDHAHQELMGQSVGQFFENASAEAALAAVTPLINGEADVVHLEQIHQRKDGSTFDVDLKLYALHDDTHNIRAFVGIARNITAQKQAAKELQDTKDFLESVVNNAPGAIYSLDGTYQYRYLSPNSEKTYGLAWEEMQQNPYLWLDIILPEDRPMVDAVFQAVVAGQQQSWAMEYRITNRLLGEVRWLSNTGSVMLNEQGQVTRIDGLAIDVTDQKRAEAEQIRLQQELLAAQQVAIRELSTPIIPVMEGIIILPLVGAIDSQRARDITRSLLAGITHNKAKAVIMDITGVDVVDSGVAGHLNKAIQAARLKGSQTIITGISDAVAETVVDLGIDWSQIDTVSNLQAGLRRAMALVRE